MSIRSELDRIRNKWAANEYPLLIRNLEVDGLRGFNETKVEFTFPVVAIVGENGTGKSTLLKAIACAYEQSLPDSETYQPGNFFKATPWDVVSGVKIQYLLKHGTDMQFRITKASHRWRKPKKLPKRAVLFLDISRTTPKDALAGYAKITKEGIKEASSEALPDDYRAKLGYVMGRSYTEARFSRATGHEKEVGVLKQAFGQYSQFHQGAGESSNLDLINVIHRMPETALVLLDEVESSLHPKAQRRLLEVLLEECRKKNLQVIMSTHSPFILEALPPESRILLMRGDGGSKVVYGASTALCMSSIDDKNHPDLVAFCEDKEAEELAKAILREVNRDLLPRINFIPAGPANVVRLLGQLAVKRKLPFNAVAILDADETGLGCAVLPGSLAPEKQVFGDLLKSDLTGLGEALGIDPVDLKDVLIEAMTNPDHHEWTRSVARVAARQPSSVWDIMVSHWVKKALPTKQAKGFTALIQDSVDGQLPEQLAKEAKAVPKQPVQLPSPPPQSKLNI